jgi:hypothetical protein
MYRLRMGVPEMEALWKHLTTKADNNTLKGAEKQLFNQLTKTLGLLRHNPRHPSLCSHDIDPMSKRYGFKVWQSYLENRKPAAGRLFWAYGPGRKEISILGIEPHPEDKKRGAYDRIKLSQLPDEPFAS